MVGLMSAARTAPTRSAVCGVAEGIPLATKERESVVSLGVGSFAQPFGVAVANVNGVALLVDALGVARPARDDCG